MMPHEPKTITPGISYQLKSGSWAEVVRIIGRGRNRQVVWWMAGDNRKAPPRRSKINRFRSSIKAKGQYC